MTRFDRILAILAFAWLLSLLIAFMAIDRADAATVKIAGVCAPLPDVLARFEHDFGERMIFAGRSDQSGVIVLRAQTETWSLLAIDKDRDVACLIGAGGESEDARGKPI